MEATHVIKLLFTKRPIPIPADYRPMYKMALIVMSLKYCCRGESSSLLKLHLFSWALASDKNMENLSEHVDSNFKTELSVWGIEPALNRALQLAIAENICEMISGKKYRLSEKGNKFFKMLAQDNELFRAEKTFLSSIGKTKITDNRLSEMTKKWDLFYVKN